MKSFLLKHLNKLALTIVAGFILAVFSQMSDESGDFMANIDAKLAVINNQLPQMKNDIVSFEHVEFQYPYLTFTLKLNGISAVEIRKQELIDVERPPLLTEMCSFGKDDLIAMQTTKTKFKYIYIDEHDIIIATIILSPAECFEKD